MNTFENTLHQAKQGNKDAQYSLGLMYKNGTDGCPINKQEAIHWLNEASKQGVADAGFWISTLVADKQNAWNWLVWAAERGSCMACNDLATAYARKGDMQNALQNWNRAYHLGDHVHAPYNLYTYYSNNRHDAQDANNALFFLKEAAAGEHPQALLALGNEYYWGKSPCSDSHEIIELWEKAWNLGLPEAGYNLFLMYSDFTKFPQWKDSVKSRKYLMEAAQKGSYRAQCDLGCEYIASDDLDTQFEGFQLIQKSANQNNLNAMLNCGIILCGKQSLKRVKCDYPTAKKYIQYVFDHSPELRAKAQYYLAWFYYWGVDVQQDTQKAIEMLNNSAKEGCQFAQERVQFIQELEFDKRDEAYAKYVFTPQPPTVARSAKGFFNRIFGLE